MKREKRRCLCCGKSQRVFNGVLSCGNCNLCVEIRGEVVKYYPLWLMAEGDQETVEVPEGCLLVWGKPL